jgi:drug/metabolite transporter (DMT)-like permease
LELVGYSAALLAATLWSVTGLLATGPVRSIGVIPFNALRMFSVAIILFSWLMLTNQWQWPESDALRALILSGFIGIYLGDTLLFFSVKILGPRMAGLLFATNAPISFAFGVFILHESYYWLNLVGVFAVSAGVFIAIISRSKAGNHHLEIANGNVKIGLLTGFGAALCQSLGTLILFDTMRSGQDPVFASMIRISVAFIFLFISLFFPAFSGGFKSYLKLTKKLYSQILLSGMLGMGIGMSLLLWAVTVAPLGIVSILSATTPVMILPILWVWTKQRPALPSFIAAAILVSGTAMIFIAA